MSSLFPFLSPVAQSVYDETKKKKSEPVLSTPIRVAPKVAPVAPAKSIVQKVGEAIATPFKALASKILPSTPATDTAQSMTFPVEKGSVGDQTIQKQITLQKQENAANDIIHPLKPQSPDQSLEFPLSDKGKEVVQKQIANQANEKPLGSVFQYIVNNSGVNAPPEDLSPSFASDVGTKRRAGIDQPSDVLAEAEQQRNKQTADAISMMVMPEGGEVKTVAEKALAPVISEAENYVKEQIAKREAARVSEKPGILDGIKNLYGEIKKKLVDSNAPIEDTLAAAQKSGNYSILPTHDVSGQIDRVLRAPTLAGQFAKDQGFESLIKEVPNLDNLDQYMIAKHAPEVEAQGFKTGRDAQKDASLVSALKDQYEPYAQKVNQYSRDLLDYSVDSGLVSKDTAEKLKQQYPDYVPINRVFSELETSGGNFSNPRGTASISQQTVVQKLKGSEREIESPIASLLAKTNDAFAQGERNKAAQMLTSYKDLPGNPFGIEQLTEGIKAKPGQETISVFRNGIQEKYLANKDIAEAAKNLNSQQFNILQKILSVPVRVAKAGITGFNAAFQLPNIASDQLMAFINSNNGLRTSAANPGVFFKSLMEAVNHGELYDEFVRNAAGGTSFDISRPQAMQTLESLRASRSIPSKIKYTITHPSQLLRTAEDILSRGEELTRIQQYQGTKQALLKEGRTAADAELLAAKAARENTANFARKGEWGSALNSAVLYLNAGIQGSRALVRSLAERPLATSAKIAATVLMPMAVMTAWNMSDPKRKAAYQDIAEYEKEGNFVIVPPNPTQDEKGRWNVIKIKLPPEVSQLTIPVRRALEGVNGMDPLKFSEVANSLLNTPLPFPVSKVEGGKMKADTGSIFSALTPQMIKPGLEAKVNQNLFTGLPIVPDKYKDLSPELQAKPGTSGSARIIGKELNVSPIQVEEFIHSTGGAVGSQALSAVDRALAGFDIIPKEQIAKGGVLDSITARFTKANGGQAGQKDTNELKAILTKQADESFLKTQDAEVLHAELKNLPKDEANAKAREIAKTDPILITKLKNIVQDEKLGLSYDDRLLKQLDVKNGARAKFIYSKANEFATKEEKNAYINDLISKKIVTDEIKKQLRQLLNKQPS